MSEEKEDNVKVVVRCRPLSQKEITEGNKVTVKIDELRGTVEITEPNVVRTDGMASHVGEPKTFTFDHVFGMQSKQVDIYNKVARRIVDFVLEGYNGTIFAYGQTGTGKTFTMEGVRTVPELRGIIPNSFAHIFGAISKATANVTFLVRVSYLEIYNEEVRDLLGKDQTARLEVKERPDVGVYVKDLCSFVCHSPDEMDKLMTIGNKNRVVGATNMNEHSSRSHAIYTVTVECSEKAVTGKTMLRQGKLHLVDLAGSERQAKTGATGVRLKEATKINLSLSTLGNVISALVDGKSTHIPYRNSKLTRLLQDSLGGNSKTVMCANFGPADYNFDETISTLRYANRAKNIKNNAKINEDPKDAMLRQFQKEIEELKMQLEDGGGIPDGEEDEEDEEDDDDVVVGEDGQQRRVRKRRSFKSLSKDQMQEIEQRIAADRRRLEKDQNMAEEERDRVRQQLESQERELTRHRQEQRALEQKLLDLEKRLIVGGENLLEKATEQERLLEQNAKELEARRREEERLRAQLKEKEQAKVEIEDRYRSLDEEATAKTRKLKRLWQVYMEAKSELADVQQEHQREMEGLLENVRQLSRDLRLQMLAIDQCIPREYQELIESNVVYNDAIGEWQLKGVAYSGNNMRKRAAEAEEKEKKELEEKFAEPPLETVYLCYSERLDSAVFKPSVRSAKGRKSAKSAGRKKKSAS